MATLRLFIAIEIPFDIKSQIASAIHKLKATNADVRWEQTDKLHITLKFPGDTTEELLPQIVLLLEEVATRTIPFSLKYSEVGCFPNKREPRIIWVGANDSDNALLPLVDLIETGMASIGFEKEKRGFHPHATIGRVKSQRNIRDLLRTMESTTLESRPTEVAHIVLIKSELKQSGSVYTTLKEFPLSTTNRI